MNNYSISNFSTMSYFDNLVKEAGGRSQGSSMSISLIDSVMAFGYHAYLTITQRFIRSEERKKADCYSRIALRSRGSVLRSPNTLLKLQASRTPQHCQLLNANCSDNTSNGRFNSSDSSQYS